ncbi:MAG: SDR family oxidoreductase [Candidatus Nanopelagicales bacterium]|jgi:3alpha(or 20beta)-hydroxysteroid dehydrogenase|nr:SDR family oxidoreductase [Candidatus Nanopelagicales bacterium]
MGKLDGKVALITGGARGMGAVHARTLQAEGAIVVITDVLDDEGAAVAKELGITYLHHDVTDEKQWNSVITETEKLHGPIAILINNAGVVGFTPVADTDLAEWNRVLAINLTGPFLGIKTTTPSMRKVGSGVIVNISSTAGMIGYSNLSAYVSSKWGLRGLTKAAALDLAADNIRVVSVHPGGVRTPMTAGIEDPENYKRQPIKRIGEPDEIAKLVLYLVADATYSTGTEFIADGGATVGQVLNV